MENIDGDVGISEAPDSKRKQKHSKGREIITRTIKAPSFSYAWLESISDSTSQIELDEITVRTRITSALTQFLGLTGSAISIDILKVEEQECWIRIPREDLSLVLAAVGGWVGGSETDGKMGWRVKGSGNWLSALVGKRGMEKVWNP